MSKKYTAEEKIAYYKNLANAKSAYKYKKRPKKEGESKRGRSRKKNNKYYSKYGAVAGGAIGTAMYGPVGGVIGTGLGGLAGAALSSIMGHGAYTVNRNTIVKNTVPQFVSRMSDGCIRMKHKEFISDVVTSATPGAFSNRVYKLSATSNSTFPYLSQIAVNFEEFAFEGLVFSYVPSSGSISTTGQLGTVIMATQYNALSQPFTNKQQAEASTYAVSQVVSQPVIHPIECDAKQTPSNGLFYCQRPSLQLNNQDPRWQQLGQFNMMTQGAPNASENIGELWVSYDVVLMKPILIQDDGEQADHWSSATGIVVGTTPFGSDFAISDFSDGFTQLVAPNSVEIDASFNGNIAISYGVHHGAGTTGTIGTDPTFTAGVGVTPLNILHGSITNQYVKSYFDQTNLVLWTTGYFTIASTGVPSVITLVGGAALASTSMDLIVEQVPADFD